MTKITYFGSEIKGFEITTADGYGCIHYDNPKYPYKLQSWNTDLAEVNRIDLYVREDPSGRASEVSLTYFDEHGRKIGVDNFPIENVVKYRIIEKTVTTVPEVKA